MADWSGLHKDILDMIATRLSNHLNYYGFTAVCSSWRSVGIEHHRRNFPRQCLGLITPGQTVDAEKRCFVQPFAQNIKPAPLQLPMPYYCCGSTLGWVVYIDDSYDMQLFNPFSVVENTKREFFQDAIYFKERFYAVYCPGAVVACDFSNNQQILTEYAPRHQEEKILDKRYLVEMDGELHQVARMIQFVPTYDDVEDDCDEDEDVDEEEVVVPGYQDIQFIVLKLEESGGSRKWVEVKSIGDNALFVGYNTSFSLSALDFVGCKRNCIYFTNDKIPFDWRPERMDRIIGIYNLEKTEV
ncbi:Ubiquitin-protein ligase protein [Thalictrum thalictroides]|uniref:Ubiquitin-protein ligase protein n=1 Tax=Thalictrum thalictroides TaxID=46969 RepID=A0A7J6VIW4_THATH|nr:Ubiquitin-protein ligase protein [Thalictrum thalictroides]